MASSKLPILNAALHNCIIGCYVLFLNAACIWRGILVLVVLAFASVDAMSLIYASSWRLLWGWFFLIIGSLSFFGFLYAAVISKLLPSSDNAVISAIQNDWYYCFLVPLTLPILVVAVYFHWLSMKLFKHA